MINSAYDAERTAAYAEANRRFFGDKVDPSRVFIYTWIKKVISDPSRKSILDIGCGSGDDVKSYAQMGFNKVYGIDPSIDSIRASIKNARQYREPVFLWQADFEQIPCPSESIDIVVSRFALHYLRNFDKAYDEVSRILAPGDYFIVAVDHPIADWVESEKVDQGGVTYCRTKLYGGAQTLPLYPLHSIGDYLSPVFFKHFDLQDLQDPVAPDRDFKGPNQLLFAARKR